MVSKEEISMVGFTIVAYAGDAKTDLLNALKLASTLVRYIAVTAGSTIEGP